jgi:hypothetical protein
VSEERECRRNVVSEGRTDGSMGVHKEGRFRRKEVSEGRKFQKEGNVGRKRLAEGMQEVIRVRSV